MPTYLDKEWKAMLSHLAQRDASVELSRQTAGDDQPPVVYRTRLFGVRENGCIIVEQPRQAVMDKSFGKGDDIELLMMQNNERLIATCTILDVFIKDLNPTTRVTSYLLSPGRRPQRDQRRSFFRVNVAAMELGPAVMTHGLSPDQTDERDRVAFQSKTLTEHATEARFQFNAKVVNISAGGLGVVVRANRVLLGQIKRSRDFICEATFTSIDSIEVPVQVMYLLARGEDVIYLGLMFNVENEGMARALEDQMHQLCMLFQRQALQRRRA